MKYKFPVSLLLAGLRSNKPKRKRPKALCSKILTYTAFLFLLSGCLSIRITLRLPQELGKEGTLDLEYRLTEALQNISNYPAPDEGIAPLPLPLWRGDFLAIAAQSPSIELLDYSFHPTDEQGEYGIVKATLSFRTEDDLQLLLGSEIQWSTGQFRWYLAADELDEADASYPQLDGDLSDEERELLQNIFRGETLELQLKRRGMKQRKQEISLADFVTGQDIIDLQASW